MRKIAPRLPCLCGRKATHYVTGPWSGDRIEVCEACAKEYGTPYRLARLDKVSGGGK